MHAKLQALETAGGDPAVIRLLASMIAGASDAELTRINAVLLAQRHGLDEEAVIGTLVRSAKLGLFEMTWNLICPGCACVIDASTSLKSIKPSFVCSLCAVGYEPTLDQLVEVSFTVSAGLRRVAAHDPDSMSPLSYYHQLLFSSALRLPETEKEYFAKVRAMTLEFDWVARREKMVFTATLAAGWHGVWEPITHGTTFVIVEGEPTADKQELAVTFTDNGATPDKVTVRPGPLRVTIENRTDRRILPGMWILGDELHAMFHAGRREFLTAKRLLSNQTFRDLYRTDTLDVDQRLKIASLTVLFTDLKGSTELYETVGDLVAYDLVKSHFAVLAEVISARGGAIVKTIGDAVMATFPTPDRGMAAALEMREAMKRFNLSRKHDDLLLKIGLHEGPCLAVMLNERLDYFGQTVNIASRVQGLARDHSIFATAPIIESPTVTALLAAAHLTPLPQRATLRGIREEVTVYQVP